MSLIRARRRAAPCRRRFVFNVSCSVPLQRCSVQHQDQRDEQLDERFHPQMLFR